MVPGDRLPSTLGFCLVLVYVDFVFLRWQCLVWVVVAMFVSCVVCPLFKFSLRAKVCHCDTEMVQVWSSGVAGGRVWTPRSPTRSDRFESRCHRWLRGTTFLKWSDRFRLLRPTPPTFCSGFHSPGSTSSRACRCRWDRHLLCAEQQQWYLAIAGLLTWWSIGSDDGFARSRGGWVLQPHLQWQRIRHLGSGAAACSLQWPYVWGGGWKLCSSGTTCTSSRGGSPFSIVAGNDFALWWRLVLCPKYRFACSHICMWYV